MTAISDEQFISTIYDRLLIEDDTEESVPGSDYHLAAIFALYDVLLRYAQRAMKRWYVTAEVLVLVDVPDRVRNPWRAMPDVYVVLDTPDTFRISLDTRTGESFPQFLCEVASDSTWDRDIVEKQRVYADSARGSTSSSIPQPSSWTNPCARGGALRAARGSRGSRTGRVS